MIFYFKMFYEGILDKIKVLRKGSGGILWGRNGNFGKNIKGVFKKLFFNIIGKNVLKYWFN